MYYVRICNIICYRCAYSYTFTHAVVPCFLLLISVGMLCFVGVGLCTDTHKCKHQVYEYVRYERVKLIDYDSGVRANFVFYLLVFTINTRVVLNS